MNRNKMGDLIDRLYNLKFFGSACGCYEAIACQIKRTKPPIFRIEKELTTDL